MKLFLNLSFLLVIVAGSIGIPVFQHSCDQSNVVEKTIFVSPANCHEKTDAQLVHACCVKKQKKVTHNCCSDEVSSYKIGFFKGHSDSFHFVIDQPVLHPVAFTGRICCFPETDNLVLGFTDLPPPKLTDRLALLQVWRI